MLLRDDGLFDRAPRHARELYLRSSWTLCMELRQGVPFATAYKTVVSQANVAEALAYLPPDSKGKGGKGQLKGRFKATQSEAEGDPRKRPGPCRTSTQGYRFSGLRSGSAEWRASVPFVRGWPLQVRCVVQVRSWRAAAATPHTQQAPAASCQPRCLGTARSAPAAKGAARSLQWAATCSTRSVWCLSP